MKLKKILAISLAAGGLIISGCQKNDDKSKLFPVEDIYTSIDSVEKLRNLKKSDVNTMVYIGRTTCGTCQAFTPTLEAYLNDNIDIDLYYFDVESIRGSDPSNSDYEALKAEFHFDWTPTLNVYSSDVLISTFQFLDNNYYTANLSISYSEEELAKFPYMSELEGKTYTTVEEKKEQMYDFYRDNFIEWANNNKVIKRRGILNYKKITEKMDNNENFIFYVYDRNCAHCREFMPKVDQYLDENIESTIYYLDITKENGKYLDSTLTKKDLDSLGITATPTTLAIKDGKISDIYVGSDLDIAEFVLKNSQTK